MNEPRRWLDDPHTSSDLKSVLEAASAPPPLPAELSVQLAGYAAHLAAQGVLAKVGGVSLWHKLFFAGGGSSKTLLVLSLLGAAGVGTYALLPTSAPIAAKSRPPAASTAVARTSTVRARPLPLPVTEPAQAAFGRSPNPTPSAARSAVAPGASATRAQNLEASAPVASSTSTIADEAKLLESARSFLDDSPALALDLTEQHRRLHPSGQLSAERELVAIEALLRLGRRAEAERRAAPTLEQAPGGLYARRLRQLLSPAPPPESNPNNH